MQLTDLEKMLVRHVAAGTIFDLAPGAADDAIDATVMGSWDTQHEIRAEVIRDILRGRQLPAGGADPHGLQLRGARIIGRLDLDHMISPMRLSLKGCHLLDGVSGKSCQIPDLDLSWSVVDVTEQYASEGAVCLLGAQITGQLVLRGATLTNETGPALTADGVSVGGSVFLDVGFTATGHGVDGAVCLRGAKITGQVSLRGATLTNETGPALHADGVNVGGGVFLDVGFTATGHGEDGAVRLLGAQITGQLVLRGATLTNETGPALTADGVSVGGSVFLTVGFTATGHGEDGAVRLSGAQITGQLVLRDATLTNETGLALTADGVSVGGDVFLNGGFTATGHGVGGAVRLLGTQIAGGLRVADATVGQAASGTGWNVDGLTYDGYPTVGFTRWLDFLRDGTTSYAAQPYQQLAAVARAAGHDADARRALIAQRDDQVKRGSLTGLAKTWARFTKLTLGYGYQPWRALIGVAGILLIAILVTSFVPGALAVVTTSTTHKLISTPCTSIQTFQIAVDMTIPLVSTSARSTCHVTSTVGGQAVGWIGVFLTFAGWALTALFAAGFTRAIRQA